MRSAQREPERSDTPPICVVVSAQPGTWHADCNIRDFDSCLRFSSLQASLSAGLYPNKCAQRKLNSCIDTGWVSPDCLVICCWACMLALLRLLLVGFNTSSTTTASNGLFAETLHPASMVSDELLFEAEADMIALLKAGDCDVCEHFSSSHLETRGALLPGVRLQSLGRGTSSDGVWASKLRLTQSMTADR